jgi:hypothetical protein
MAAVLFSILLKDVDSRCRNTWQMQQVNYIIDACEGLGAVLLQY